MTPEVRVELIDRCRAVMGQAAFVAEGYRVDTYILQNGFEAVEELAKIVLAVLEDGAS